MATAASSRQQPPEATSVERNKTLVRRWIDEGFNQRRLTVVDELFTDQFAVNGRLIGRDGLKKSMGRHLTGFPDLRVTIDDTLAEDSKVGIWYTVEGTHKGEFEAMPPTGTRVKWEGFDLFTIEDGKIASARFLSDFHGLLTQLGATSPGAPPRRQPSLSAQVTIDHENKYPNVGTIMVWRVDDAGKPVELRAFVSGTLIRDRVMVTAGHFTAPAKALGSLPPSVRMFASFSATDAKDPKTWIPVVGEATHPSMPHCPPPPQCDPTDDILVAPLEPGIADVGLIFLAHAPPGIKPARLAEPGTLDRSEGTPTIIVGYGTTTPRDRSAPPDAATWDGTRRVRTSTVRRVVDETWALWSIPSYVCSGDSGGGIFLSHGSSVADGDVLVANVSDGGRDCRRHNNNNRLDTRSIQSWIDETLRQSPGF